MAALPLCGRVDELATIALSWRNVVADGSGPQVVVLTGEGGSGKSRLVAEAAAALRPAPAVVFSGRARAHSPAPYDWIASALSGRDARSAAVPGDALAWLTQRPDAPARRFVPDALLRVASDLVRSLVGAGPGVLVIEDLHDLDPASLALVDELAAQPLPALILVTSRSSDEAAFPALAGRVLARLSGTRRSTRLHLAPLTSEDVGAALAAAFGGPVAPEAATAAHRRTGGNAFWIAELISAARSARSAGPEAVAAGPLPPHVASLVTDRLAPERPETVDVATAAALLGDRLGTELLAHVCGPGAEHEVRRLVHLGLLAIGPDGEPRFRYPLLREAVAGTALGATRAAVSAKAGEHDLAATTDEAAATHVELARCLLELGRPEAARRHTERAAALLRAARGDEPDPELTAREREVLGCMASGMSNQQVARSLGISIRTVTVHVSRVLRKTGSASRTEAAVWAVRTGTL
jgi:DNA-binding CsgD family transcriptional regulator